MKLSGIKIERLKQVGGKNMGYPIPTFLYFGIPSDKVRMQIFISVHTMFSTTSAIFLFYIPWQILLLFRKNKHNTPTEFYFRRVQKIWKCDINWLRLLIIQFQNAMYGIWWKFQDSEEVRWELSMKLSHGFRPRPLHQPYSI